MTYKPFAILAVALALAACSPAAAPTPTNAPAAPANSTTVSLAVTPTRAATSASPVTMADSTVEPDSMSEGTAEANAGSGQSITALCEAATPAPEPAARQFAQAEQVLQPGVNYRAIFCTEGGAVYVDLFEDYAPVTVNNFVFLAQQNYYNNTTFHRVLADFMAQGGDPTGTGRGGPGYQFKDEFVSFLTFDRPGLLAMANANNREQGIFGTNGSQFFITTVLTPHLDYNHTIFGEVLEGFDVVQNLPLRDPQLATTPGPRIDTVIIVTDPSTVASSFTSPAPATQQEVLTAFGTVGADIPAEAGLEVTVSNVLDAATAVNAFAPDAAGEDARRSISDLMTQNGFEYAVSSSAVNVTCNLESLPFSNTSYTLLVFGSETEASAFRTTAALPNLLTNNGMTRAESPNVLGDAYYTESTTTCNQPGTRGVMFVQRGRYIAVVDVSHLQGGQYTADILMAGFSLQVFEVPLGDVLRREVY